ncbi:4-O-dimethylallyl-L-tyrosine synthase [Cytospora mali]|uniref:4-O-dimethylallyl-L-tyrosine synthase n=1 Tax=Cytospora mali TaxID=578113 RepID=A0A194V4P7_CYTMA|nr:4-O-dimethylallyl-L-tyrosine synthase [Valsa mali var. pyri (nom. inval.)]
MQLSVANSWNPLKGFVKSLIALLFQNDAISSWWGDGQQSQTASKSLCPSTAAFLRVDSDHQNHFAQLDCHARYWWTSSGHALAILLEKAGYPTHAQHQLLEFVRAITPSLGFGHAPGREQRWKSFMTDDHTPIELSWDWRTGCSLPKIRFSIEPVGIDAGTHIDPNNQYAASRLLETMARLLPESDMEWLGHFQKQLNNIEVMAGIDPIEGHRSREFYGFDLNEDGSIMSKAYFFPGFKAKATRQSNFDVIVDTIKTAPNCTPGKLQALQIFQEYVYDTSSPLLEMDMLAIDLVDSAEPRFKIYFRVRDTSFAFVREIMSLGNRIHTPELNRGLEELRRLYHALLGRLDTADDKLPADDVQLPAKDHRTAGILYNVEFKYGSKNPKVKAYLPVRHYARSEKAIISALTAHLKSTESSTGSPRTTIINYTNALKTILQVILCSFSSLNNNAYFETSITNMLLAHERRWRPVVECTHTSAVL